MELVRMIRERVSPPPLEMDRLRKSKPARNPAVTGQPKEDGTLTLCAPLDARSPVAAVLAKSLKLPQSKSFELDPVGALVWSMCDGKTTFSRISAAIQTRYKMNRLEAEAALTAFLQTLSRRRLVSLYVPKAK